MDRRLSHWQCTFCRHENPLSEQAEVCGKCNGARQQLGDSDAVAREGARRSARSREVYGRALNLRGVGCETVPRLTPGLARLIILDAPYGMLAPNKSNRYKTKWKDKKWDEGDLRRGSMPTLVDEYSWGYDKHVLTWGVG